MPVTPANGVPRNFPREVCPRQPEDRRHSHTQAQSTLQILPGIQAGLKARLYDQSYWAASTSVGDNARTRSSGASAIKNPRRPPLM